MEETKLEELTRWIEWGREETAIPYAERNNLQKEAMVLWKKEAEKAKKKEIKHSGKKEYGYAAGAAEKAGLRKEALKLYLKANKYSEAARMEREDGRLEKALKLYLKDDDYHHSAEIAEEQEKYNKAVNLLEKFADDSGTVFYQQAAEMAKKHGLWEREIKIWKKAAKKTGRGDPKEMKAYYGFAAKIAEKHGQNKEAYNLYIKAENFEKLIDIEEKNGLLEKAIEHCDKIVCVCPISNGEENYWMRRKGKLYEKLGNYQETTAQYLQTSSWKGITRLLKEKKITKTQLVKAIELEAKE